MSLALSGKSDFWDYRGETFPVERFDSIPEQDVKDISISLVAHRGVIFKKLPGIEKYGIYSSGGNVPLMGIGPSKNSTKSRNIYLFPALDSEIRENILRRGVN